MKKVFSIVVVIAILCTMIPKISISADATTTVTNSANVNGSMYSDTYATKLDNVFAGKVNLFSNTTAKFPLGASLDNNQEYLVANAISGYQCYIYAQAVYYYLFGDIPFQGDGYVYWSDSKKVLTNQGEASYDLFRNSGVSFGAYLRTTSNADGSYNGNYGHSMIILSYDSSNITYLEGNADGNGLVRITTRSWSEFNSNQLEGKGRKICHIVQCNSAACSHSYNEIGICIKCDQEYDFQSSYQTVSAGYYMVSLNGGIYLRTQKPYTAASASSTQIAEGTQVEVLGNVTNAFGNIWYKVSYNGVTGYTSMNNLTWSGYGAQDISCTISSPAEGAVVPQEAYPVVGTVTSKYPLKEVKAYIDGLCYATVTLGNASTLDLRSSEINYLLDFASLSSGDHALTIKAQDIYHSELITVCTRKFATQNTSASSTTPGKPMLNISSDFLAGSTVQFTWDQTVNTTHYNLWIYQSDGNGGWDGDWYSYVESGLTKTFETGEYKALLLAYNSNAWEADGSDWSHTYGDEVYFTIACGHSYGSSITEMPGCSSDGVMTYTCNICGDSYTETIGAYGHSYEDWTTVTQATCLQTGVLQRACSRCGDTQTETVPGEHSYENGLCITCKKVGTCGDNPTWTLDDVGTLTISGTGVMTDYEYEETPWFGNSSVKTVIIEEGVANIGDHAFSGSYSLTGVSIPDSVTSIGSHAFYDCISLTGINIPDSVTSVGAWAFSNCGLTSITIPDSMINIGNCVFAECGSLTSVKLPASVTAIGEAAFWNCNSLTDVYYDGTVEQWREISVQESNDPLLKATIHGEDFVGGACGDDLTWTLDDSGTLTISGTGPMRDYRYGSSPWRGDGSVKTVVIEDGVTTIGEDAFAECDDLTSITISDSVTSIGEDVFFRCYSLNEISVAEGNQYYSSDSFGVLFDKGKEILIQAPQNLIGSYVVPANVESISSSAFLDCHSMTSINIPASVTSIGYGAFCRCYSLNRISVSEDNQYYSSDSYGILLDKNKELLIQAPGNLTGNYTIPSSVTTIDEYAFWHCDGLIGIVIPASVTSIGNCAFMDCTSLAGVVIPVSVTSIGKWTFYGCTSLASVAIPVGVTSIGEWTFVDCTSLASVTIPDSVTSIDGYAFWNCNSLTDVYYGGTAGQWEAISVMDGNEPLLNAAKHFTELTVEAVSISTQPTKIVYEIGESLDTAGLSILVTYSDGSTQTITEGFTTSGFSSTSAGTKAVTVSYGGKSVSFTVTVKESQTDMPKYVLTGATATAGSVVEVYISIANNPGIISLRNTVSYDTAALELIKVEDTGLLAGYTTPSATLDSPYTLRWADSLAAQNNTANGRVVKLTFAIKEDAPVGSYEISVAPIEARAVDGTKVVFAEANASVTVIDYVAGDTDGDGEVSDWDAIMLNRCLAGWDVEIDLAAADVDGDGEVSDWDAIVLERYLAGWDVRLES